MGENSRVWQGINLGLFKESPEPMGLFYPFDEIKVSYLVFNFVIQFKC